MLVIYAHLYFNASGIDPDRVRRKNGIIKHTAHRGAYHIVSNR